jgi:multidrug resistance efflux pump
MRLESLDDVQTWGDALRQGALTTVDPADLGQAWSLLLWAMAELRATNREQDARLAAHDAQIADLKATSAALERAEDDLDIFQAGYERGDLHGWQHALEKEERS